VKIQFLHAARRARHDANICYVEGFMYLTQQDVDDGLSLDRLRRVVRTYVQNVFSYHRQYIYNVLTHQYTDWERYPDPQVFTPILYTHKVMIG